MLLAVSRFSNVSSYSLGLGNARRKRKGREGRGVGV